MSLICRASLNWKIILCTWCMECTSHKHGFETRIRLYGSTRLTGNRSSTQFFKPQESAYVRKSMNRSERGW